MQYCRCSETLCETRIAQQRPGGHLDDPDPERFAADAGAVEIHEDGLDGLPQFDGMNRIVRRIAHRRLHIRQRVVGEADELDLAVAGRGDGPNAVAPDAEGAVRAGFKQLEARLIGNRSNAGDGSEDIHGFADHISAAEQVKGGAGCVIARSAIFRP
ncbi:MAG: hypothetical protein NTW86_31675 [Candidatus Sumerlaeota bacterium]|nr:hypothetical protein [Candidatus Sumerlaeota bacterium]